MVSGYSSQSELQDRIDEITREYIKRHPDYVDAAIEKDAALKTIPREEVAQTLLVYPGVIAIAVHEEAHHLYQTGKRFIARQLSEAAHSRTGIDIHPATQIGDRLFIDHGTGDVIGETAKIGKNTHIMHKVTLGAYIKPTEVDPLVLAHRHPEIGDDCFIGPGVEVLGNVKVGHRVHLLTKSLLTGNHITVGDDVRIGTGAVIEDGNDIKPGVKIGEGAFIARNTGVIEHDIPAHSLVSRTEQGQLCVVDKTALVRTSAIEAIARGQGQGSGQQGL